jgi:hypothetical protein
MAVSARVHRFAWRRSRGKASHEFIVMHSLKGDCAYPPAARSPAGAVPICGRIRNGLSQGQGRRAL